LLSRSRSSCRRANFSPNGYAATVAQHPPRPSLKLIVLPRTLSLTGRAGRESDCRCRVGFHGSDPASCVECEPGYFCIGGTNRDAGAAAPGSYFPAGSSSGSDSALCPMGYMCPG
jgi:hypothetical protein